MTALDGSVTALDGSVTALDAPVTAVDASATSLDAPVTAPDAVVAKPDAHIAAVDAAASIDAVASPFAGGDGSASNPYLILTIGELQLVRTFPDNDYILGVDLDLTGVDFAPIGTFTHTFDGGNFTISNWSYTETSGATNVGFFTVMNGTVKNLTIANATVVGNAAGDSFNGIVAGTGDGLFDHVVVSGSVAAQDTQSNSSIGTGGIIGAAAGSGVLTLRFCSNQATVAGHANVAGGLIGSTNSEAEVSDSSSIGDVSGSTAAGIAGVLAVGSIVRTFSTGTITASGGLAAGLVAEAYFDGDATTNLITDCYSSAAVSGGGYNGGLVGLSVGALAITTSYAIGSVQSAGSFGGLMGRTFDAADSVGDDSYWDVDTTGQSTSAGNLGTSESDSAMLLQATYVGFDFANVWQIASGGYPTLR